MTASLFRDPDPLLQVEYRHPISVDSNLLLDRNLQELWRGFDEPWVSLEESILDGLVRLGWELCGMVGMVLREILLARLVM